MQLIAYGLLAEEYFNKSFRQAFVIVGEGRKVLSVKLNESLLQSFYQILEQLELVLTGGLLPSSSATNYQCAQCEYLKFCNDRF